MDKPVLIVIAGPNGSGKTTITKQLLAHPWTDDCTYVNPDEIAQAQFGGWNDPNAVIKAANHAQRMREDCLVKGQNILFETVFSIPEKLDYIRQAQQSGFFIRLFFICTDDPQINIQRVVKRVKKGKHDVPQDKIIKRYYRSVAYVAEAVHYADRAYFYDNSTENQPPKLLFRTAAGLIKKTYPRTINRWAKDIYKTLPTKA